MSDARLFTTDAARAQAIDLRRLLLRLENSDAADSSLGDEILTALNAPAGIGDPTDCMDCAADLADWLRQPRLDVIAQATNALRERVRRGWKCAAEISAADAARAMTVILLRVQLAKLERAPA